MTNFLAMSVEKKIYSCRTMNRLQLKLQHDRAEESSIKILDRIQKTTRQVDSCSESADRIQKTRCLNKVLQLSISVQLSGLNSEIETCTPGSPSHRRVPNLELQRSRHRQPHRAKPMHAGRFDSDLSRNCGIYRHSEEKQPPLKSLLIRLPTQVPNATRRTTQV